jgi:hypothetical protein
MNVDIGSPDRNIEIGATRSGSASEMLKIFERGGSPPVRQPGATSIRRSGPRKPSRNPCFSGVRGSSDGNVQKSCNVYPQSCNASRSLKKRLSSERKRLSAVAQRTSALLQRPTVRLSCRYDAGIVTSSCRYGAVQRSRSALGAPWCANALEPIPRLARRRRLAD